MTTEFDLRLALACAALRSGHDAKAIPGLLRLGLDFVLTGKLPAMDAEAGLQPPGPYPVAKATAQLAAKPAETVLQTAAVQSGGVLSAGVKPTAEQASAGKPQKQGVTSPNGTYLQPYQVRALAVLREPHSVEQAAALLKVSAASVKSIFYGLRAAGYDLPAFLPPAAATPKTEPEYAPEYAPEKTPAQPAIKSAEIKAAVVGTSKTGENDLTSDAGEVPRFQDMTAPPGKARPPTEFELRVIEKRRAGWDALRLSGYFSMSIAEMNLVLRKLEAAGHLAADAPA